ncbi:hypothetical protein [Jeotgalibacillus sp. R-1-5s-1]|uniref:hypothetical protein n=1 Tax=Jeotgalibacillus sp. R-1-5s-1 TaxID=2555897 RepID=UPI00106AC22E|nr:hypothetical protein [Jeotgalibacillus sp. R-1-5s-1]TFE00851.1 hypothetical protein E2491_04900 [Jeotgalibacillus sp. R-1-5s-1]
MKILGMILVLSIFLTGCSEPVSMDGKLGGSLSSFVETYGENQKAEDDLLYDYISDEGVAAVFMEDQASVITIDLTSEGQELLSIEDAGEYALSFAPSDADEVERTQDP